MTADPVHFRVLNEIGIINQLAQTAFERAMPPGMTLAQFIVLNHFVRLGGTKGPAELARAFQVTKATMTSTLQRLVAKELVSVAPDPDDGRGKRVAITPQGRAMRDACIAALGPLLRRLADLWPEADADRLLPQLVALRALLDANRPTA
jgi:DNA-binding MarR family transcriptional regulator